MSEYPFGEVRRVRYQDGAGNVQTVRAKLLKPDPVKHPGAVVVLEISESEKAHLPLQKWQFMRHEPVPKPLAPISSPRK